MNKLTQRLLTFFIGIPIVLGIVFIDYWNHLPINALACIVSAFAADELYRMFQKKDAFAEQKASDYSFLCNAADRIPDYDVQQVFN